ncbi:MAG: tetratricopeptide repeat protein [Desulfuromonadales bacterium]|nr:tetratricopeptide repeat protein [Desulfuromonadales bacterium]
MSLVNQMLRDLQQRQRGSRRAVPAIAPRKRPRRRFSATEVLGSVPPLLWVGAGGVAGLFLLWGVSGWLSGGFGPGSSAPVPQPPPELMAIANSPSPQAVEAPTAAPRRAPPVPIDVPPPPPPLAYGSSEPAEVASPAAATSSVMPAPTHAPSVSTAVHSRPSGTYFSDQPQLMSSSASLSPPAGFRGTSAGPATAAPVVPRSPGLAASPPGRAHPDLLPGAVNTTNLALRKTAREPVAAPAAATPYGRAEAAYREGRQAYDANRTAASLEALRRALEFYPGHLPARALLVDQLEMGGRADEARALVNQGLAIAPDYTPFRKRAARMLLDRGDMPGAIRALTGNGLPRVEDDPELHRMLAGIYLQLGENFLAAQTYRNLLIGDPQEGPYWLGLGDALAADGQPEEAQRAYRKALSVGGLSREEAARARSGSARF